ncbi:hypothetical protein [Cupriavidus oxalaticus]|uniref:Uncharacterized protein n=1 Tax=Cupriavidus oxalaticus TaxID=96344 RepID=A0A5P3VMZ4_9BURK|nr:hypothetical protein [Cupriavidus oxalaticus]QEZ46782.1 hypothetical protein D2917_21525 [Cupriavidus oxalaticus]
MQPKPFFMQNQFKEAAMLERSRQTVLNSADWLTVAQIAERTGSNQASLHELFGQWVRERRIFTICRDDVDYFPGYGLDAGAGWQPFKGLRTVLEVFGDARDGWGLAYWFLSANSFLEWE